METQKKHFYLCTVNIVYATKADEEKGVPSLRAEWETNVLIMPYKKQITAEGIDTIRQIALMKAEEKHNIEPQQAIDLVIRNIVHLGIMSEKEFNGTTAASRLA